MFAGGTGPFDADPSFQTHPGFGALDGAPSVAAVVGSVDSHFSQFPATRRMNPRRTANSPNPTCHTGM